MIEDDSTMSENESAAEADHSERIFLVVVDQTEEMETALYFACKRAYRTGGRVALLYVIEPPEFQHWLGVERVMEEEARAEAERTLQSMAERVQSIVGKMPVLHVRQGTRREQLLALINEEPAISVLVLGTAAGHEDPGPLVNYLIGQMSGTMRLPVILVPGLLSKEEIDAVT
ncbi:MAG: universal stress protein [Alphaproteobacteria bacterium]|nr:universal stress protein [Alphaproteobacteria bacterium]